MKITGKKLDSKEILNKYWMNLKLENHKLNTKTVEYLIVDAPNWVITIPQLDNGKYLMVKQYRAAWESISIEFPAGRVEGTESFKETVDRELIEETGYKAENHEFLCRANPTSYSTQVMELWKSIDLSFVGQNLDFEEEIEVLHLEKDEIFELVKNGKIMQLATIFATKFL